MNRISTKKFKIVTNSGYKIAEVDRFLDRVHESSASEQENITREDIDNIRFSLTRRKGYDPREVDTYLDGLAEEKNTYKPDNNVASDSLNSPAGSSEAQSGKEGPAITSDRLRELTPPVVDGIGYQMEEVDTFLQLVADTLQIFEEKSIVELNNIRADQYLNSAEIKKLLTSDQIRWALFTVSEEGGYDMLGVDAAVNRLADALDHHWQRKA